MHRRRPPAPSSDLAGRKESDRKTGKESAGERGREREREREKERKREETERADLAHETLLFPSHI